MKANVKYLLLAVLFSAGLITTYSNCSGKKFEAYQESTVDKSSLNPGSVNICPNGAANFPTCSVTSFGNCVNGATNPPTCNSSGSNSVCATGAVNPPDCTLTSMGSCINGTLNPPLCNSFSGPGSTCSNGATNYPTCTFPGATSCPNLAVNYPTCTVNANNICLNGATNPPSCIKGSNICANGANNYPNCDDFGTTPPELTVNRVFNVFATKSGPLMSYKIDIQMEFNQADLNSSGGIFIFGISPVGPDGNSTIMVCTNPCGTNNWKKWVNGNNYDWSAFGFRSKVGVSASGVVGLQTVLSGTFDVTSLGGYTFYAGYGLGSNVYNAINEMLAYRSASLPGGRFLPFATIPIQSRSIEITGPGGGSPGSLNNYDLWAKIAPSSADYGRSGYFFVMVQTADKSVTKLYSFIPSTGTYGWLDWNGDVNALGDKYYKYDPEIKNEFFQIFKGDANFCKGCTVVAGYGNGDNPTDAGRDCMTNIKYNPTAFIVK